MMGRKVAEVGIEDSFVKVALLCEESLRWISVLLRYLILISFRSLDFSVLAHLQ